MTQIFSEALLEAVIDGQDATVGMLLCFSEEIENLESDTLYQALLYAYLNQYSDIAKMLLDLPAAKAIITEHGSELLTLVGIHGNQQLFEYLLALPAVNDIVHEDNNVALRNAAYFGHVAIVERLLMMPTVRANAKAITYEDLRDSLSRNYPEITLLLLELPEVRAIADKFDNSLLYSAVKDKQIAVIQKLLTIPAVANKVHFFDHFLLSWAIQGGYVELVKQIVSIPTVGKDVNVPSMLLMARMCSQVEIMKILIACPWVERALMQNFGNVLQWFVKYILPHFPHVLDNMLIYGIPYAKLEKLVNPEIFDKFLQNPIQVLIELKVSSDIVEAVGIKASQYLVQEFEDIETKAENEREIFINVDDEKRINAIKKHYQTVIKPAFQKKFSQRGDNEQESVVSIEQSIRQLLLTHIEQEAQEAFKNDPSHSRASAVLSYIHSLTPENKHQLFQGTDEALMKYAREVFCDTQSDAQTAWRALDAWAPVGGDWPNLLTAPLADADKSMYTVNAVGLDAPTSQMASDLAREMLAYSFLLVMDAEGDEATHATRQSNFIAKIAEIRRAHNEYSAQIDDPSCLPGTISRMGDMWLAHSKAAPLKVKDLIIEELRSLVIAKFKQLDKSKQKEIYLALVMLSDCNAEDVINGKIAIESADILLRNSFKLTLGTLDEIYQTVNQSLKARGIWPIERKPFMIYSSNFIVDIGGTWIVKQLTTIYRQIHNEDLENPYQYFIDSQSANMPMQQAMLLLRNVLGDVELEGKNNLIFQAANDIALNKMDDAWKHLESGGIENHILAEIKIIVSQNLSQKRQLMQKKANLWNVLHSQLDNVQFQDKGEALREIVTKVIDQGQPLKSVLEANNVTFNISLLPQFAQFQSQDENSGKRKREQKPTNEKKARLD